MSRDSVVGIATGYGLDDRGVGVRVSVGSRIFSSPRRPDRLWGPPNLLSNGYRGREADHSSPASAEVKKMWIYISTSPTPSWRGAKHGQLYLTFQYAYVYVYQSLCLDTVHHDGWSV
jgi:hypothetical protein